MEGEGEREESQDCGQSVSSTSEEKESAQEVDNTSPDESGGSSDRSGMEAEPEVVAEKVKYLCGEDDETLPDRFGDRKSQVRFGSKRPSFAIFASSFSDHSVHE